MPQPERDDTLPVGHVRAPIFPRSKYTRVVDASIAVSLEFGLADGPLALLAPKCKAKSCQRGSFFLGCKHCGTLGMIRYER